MQNKNYFLQSILNNRKSFIELIAAAIIIGFGVSLAASSLLEYCDFKNKNLLLLCTGILLFLMGLGYFVVKLFGEKSFSKTLDGFFIVNFIKKEVVSIDSHDYSYELNKILNCGFSEDKALKKIWDNINFKQKDKSFNDFLKIINEATEYYLLEKLSTHLTDFFNNKKYDKKELVEYERNDIPDIFLKNRFLELFSKPMEQREAFVSEKLETTNDDSLGAIVTNFSNGAMYSRFDMTLPKNSKLQRNKDGSISIITDRFTIKLRTIISGSNTYIPWEFCKIYLGIDYENYCALISTYELDITFKFGSLFKTMGWHYYDWIDSFIVSLEENFEEDYFFKSKIEWSKAYTILKPLIQNKKG